MIAATSDSTSRPIPALIARRRRTTVGVGILMTFAGPLRDPADRRRVAGFALISELGVAGANCYPWHPLLNSKPEAMRSAGVVPLVDRGAMPVLRDRAPVPSYRAIGWMSTRTILASIAIVCLLSVRASAASNSAD